MWAQGTQSWSVLRCLVWPYQKIAQLTVSENNCCNLHSVQSIVRWTTKNNTTQTYPLCKIIVRLTAKNNTAQAHPLHNRQINPKIILSSHLSRLTRQSQAQGTQKKSVLRWNKSTCNRSLNQLCPIANTATYMLRSLSDQRPQTTLIELTFFGITVRFTT